MRGKMEKMRGKVGKKYGIYADFTLIFIKNDHFF